MKVQILGTGCPKCKKLAENAEAAGKKAGVDLEITKVTDIDEIIGFGIMITPALAIDGKVVSSGTLLSVDQIADILKTGGPK